VREVFAYRKGKIIHTFLSEKDDDPESAELLIGYGVWIFFMGKYVVKLKYQRWQED